MKYAEYGNLLSYVCKEPLSVQTTAYIFQDILKATLALHHKNILHRDLKLENVLLDEHFNVKLTDFGFSTRSSGKNNDYVHYTCKGTYPYIAPEVISL